ncbi:MAG: PAS domain S-box protein, partial [Nitrospirota bacterium]|nr:PAS domain S-box protein [Nitrospirota bacterium]
MAELLQQAEAGYRQTEERYRALVEQSLVGVYLIKGDRFIYCNEALFRMFGYETDEDFKRLSPLDLVHPADRPKVAKNIEARLRGEVESVRYGFRGLHRNGSVIHCEVFGRRIIDEGEPAILGTLVDISERIQAEDAMLEKEERFRTLVETTSDWVWEVDADIEFTYASPRVYDLLGYEPREVLRKKPFDLMPPEESVRMAGIFAGAQRPLVCLESLENTNLHKDGHEVCLETSAVSVFDVEGRFRGLRGISRDITERKKAEENLRLQLQRLSALRTIDMTVGSSLDLKVILRVFLDETMSQLGVDGAVILKFAPYMQTLDYAIGSGFATTVFQHTSLHLGQGYAGKAALERKTVIVPDLMDAPGEFSRIPQLAREKIVFYCATPLVAKGQVKGVLELFRHSGFEPTPDWLEFMEYMALQAAIAIDNIGLFDDLQRSNMELTLAYDTTLEGWARALDLRDKETEGHTRRVVEMTLRLARAMKMGEEQLVHVRRGALLHDIGKMGIPDSILYKDGPLTDEETAIMHQHPVYAYELLHPIPYLRPALDIPYAHHERWDGNGYPRRLKGEQI